MNEQADLPSGDDWLDALLRAGPAQAGAHPIDDGQAFCAAVLGRLPPARPGSGLAAAAVRRAQLLELLSSCVMGLALALLMLTLPDALATLPQLAGAADASTRWSGLLAQLLPSLALLALLAWWSLQRALGGAGR